MRILFVNDKCGFFGGVEQNVAVTAKGLRELGHDCFLSYGESSRNFDNYKSLFNDIFLCEEICAPGNTSRVFHSKTFRKGRSLPTPFMFTDFPHGFSIAFREQNQIVRMVHDHDLCCPRSTSIFHNTRICNHRAGWRCYHLDLAFLEKGSESKPFSNVQVLNVSCRKCAVITNGTLYLSSEFMRQELIMNGFPSEGSHCGSSFH